MMYVHSSPEPEEEEDDFAALSPKVQIRIDRAFDRAKGRQVPGSRKDKKKKDPYEEPPSKRRRITRSSEKQKQPEPSEDGGGGFLPPTDDDGGGFMLPEDDDEGGGGFVVDEEPESHSKANPRAGSAASEPLFDVADRIPLSLIPRALQILDLPQDTDVLSIFQQAASGWTTGRKAGVGGEEEEEEEAVSRKDWRAVCAVLVADPRDTGMDRDDRDRSSSEAPLPGSEEEEMEVDDDGAESAHGGGNDDDYAESDEEDEDGDDGDDDEDEYQVAGSSKQKQKQQNTRNAKRRGRRSPSSSPETEGPVQLTNRQRRECLKAFALFFPELAEDTPVLSKQRILIKDVARATKTLKEKLTTEEMLEMLEAFSTSPDKSLNLSDFEQMCMVTHLV